MKKFLILSLIAVFALGTYAFAAQKNEDTYANNIKSCKQTKDKDYKIKGIQNGKCTVEIGYEEVELQINDFSMEDARAGKIPTNEQTNLETLSKSVLVCSFSQDQRNDIYNARMQDKEEKSGREFLHLPDAMEQMYNTKYQRLLKKYELDGTCKVTKN